MQLLILGREKNLCLAEAESVFGQFERVSEDALIVDTELEINIDSLGGAIKVGKIISTNSKNPTIDIVNFIKSLNMNSKINFGISYYGKSKFSNSIGISIKKLLKKEGLSVRYVQSGSDKILNAASVKHNKLINKGCEILMIESKIGLMLARTTGVQDIDSYSKRDYEKPCRDRRVGMLPPKLSQIMLNIASADKHSIVVDPFCGSGGILMEAALFGIKSEGSDISEEMIKCSKENIEWFMDNFKVQNKPKIAAHADATTRTYDYDNYLVVTEGFLGKNFFQKPKIEQIKSQLPLLEDLYLEFLKNLKNQNSKPKVVVLTMPFWNIEGRKIYLNIIDEISDLGYNIHEFKSVEDSKLLYYREGQFTGRQVLKLS